MPAPYATLGDYTDRKGAVQAEEIGKVNALLADASALMRSKIPTGNVVDADLAKAICVAVAHRARRNEGGRRQVTVGGTSESFGEDGGLYVTESEIESLQGKDSGSSAYTVSLDNWPHNPYAHEWPGACW